MSVKFTSDAEKERVANQLKPTWELLKTYSLVQALHFARENGWFENKVQVKSEPSILGVVYLVEPFEKDCGCPSILKYSDYFEPPRQDE